MQISLLIFASTTIVTVVASYQYGGAPPLHCFKMYCVVSTCLQACVKGITIPNQ